MEMDNSLLHAQQHNIEAAKNLLQRLTLFRERLMGKIPEDKEATKPANPLPANNFAATLSNGQAVESDLLYQLHREIDNLEIFLPPEVKKLEDASVAVGRGARIMPHYREDEGRDDII